MTEITEANVIEQEDKAEEKQAVLLAFSNDKDPQHTANMTGLLKMFYHAVLTNRVAIMEAKNTETDTVETILVGLDQQGDAMNTYPLALAITAEMAEKYVAPDGKGDWLEAGKAE